MKSKNQIPGLKSPKQKLIQIIRNVPLCLVVAAPIIIDIGITCGLIKYFSFDKERQTIENVAKQAQNQISDRVFLRQNKYLEINNNHFESELVDYPAQKSSHRLLRPKRTEPAVTVGQKRREILDYLLLTIFLGAIIYIWFVRLLDHLTQTVSEIAYQQDSKLKNVSGVEPSNVERSSEQIVSQPQIIQQQEKRRSDYITNLLLVDMSHELRSPLNAILGFAQIMEQESSLTRSQQENMAIINHSGKRMLSTINDLVDLSKIEANRLVLAKDSFDFYLWLDSFECSLRHKADNQGLDISLIKHSQLPQYICADERRLRQILTNLVSYCLKHNQSESIIVQISSSAVNLDSIESKLQNLHFVIENLNFSLALLELVDLFDPAVSVRQKGKFYDHSPLSLPISRQLAKLMKGGITVEHDNHRQGRMIFRLDLQIEVATNQEVEIKSEFSPQKVISLELEQPNYRVLVVDDSKTNRKIMVQILEKVGFEIQEAANGKEAVDIWLRWQPHMIWMDIQMPVMDGYEATEQIKSDPQSKSLPIVAFSASSLEEQRSLFQASGCDDFVEKPFSENIIFDKIAQHLGVRYIYQSITPSPNAFRLTSEALKVMPDSWIDRLGQAAAVLDDKLLTQLLQEIPPEHPDLRDALQKQVNNFDFEQIIYLAQEKSY